MGNLTFRLFPNKRHQMHGYMVDKHLWLRFVAVSGCRRFGLSTFRFVNVSVCWHLICQRFGLATFRFVNVAVCRCFDLSTFRFVDAMGSLRFDCRRFGFVSTSSHVSMSIIPNQATFIMYCLTPWVQWVSKLPESIVTHWVRQYLVHITGLVGIVNATVYNT